MHQMEKSPGDLGLGVTVITLLQLEPALISGQYEFQGIRIMRNPATIPDAERFILVVLSNEHGHEITVAIDTRDLYVVGYQGGGDYCFFLLDHDPNAAPYNLLFPEIHNRRHRRNLPFGGHYTGDHQLNSLAGDRRHITLGMGSLSDAIQWLSIRGPHQGLDMQTAFVVIIQMISEAVRLKYIEQRVVNTMVGRGPTYFRPDDLMLDLENSWTDFRDAMVQADLTGRFPGLTIHGLGSVTSVTYTLFTYLAVIKYGRFHNAGLLSVSRRNRGHHNHDDGNDWYGPRGGGNNHQGRPSAGPSRNRGNQPAGRNNPRRRQEL
ncbi:hypothetical protein Tsubulata_037202 [Turnera subulata]|uniref:rRNA N-glycosylase n=1 Tax=Turnera subulata TaxID=218843 RepID=A0A9Q0FWW8_9ROSI|nr:hypothetical protein Tsubulata_037202 [Turnera subulata]